jgi:predicted ester cyclase
VAGKLDVADEILSRDFVAHAPAPPEFTRGPDGVKKWATSLRAGFPNDIWITHPHIVAEGDLVAIHWESGGTHEGEMMGIPPTGKQTKITGFDLFRIADDKIIEMWQDWNVLDFMQQLGALPASV